MGPIQSSVNQMLGTAAIGAGLYAQSPVGKRMAELRQLNLQEQAIKAQRQAVTEHADIDKTHGEPFTETEEQTLSKGAEEELKIHQRRFELDPTKENFDKLEQASKLAPPSPQELAAEKAEASMQAEKARRQAQRELMNKPRIYDAQGRDIYGRK